MKSGFVAILGRPNVGKSTFLNGVLNKKISIVSDKSQTTRNAIKGIYNEENAQIVFIDTPGIHKPHAKLGVEMNNMAYSSAHDADVAVLVVDVSLPYGEGDEFILGHLDINKIPLIIVFNKIDLVKVTKASHIIEIYKEKFPNAFYFETVAKDKFNLDVVKNKIIDLLPEGPKYYEDNVITDKDDIFQIKEIIREKILKILNQEVPHSVAIYINNIDYDSKPLHIYATIFVEKESQKGIVIGAQGRRIKSIGTKARESIEKLLGKHVFLELMVKVASDWRDDDESLKNFGYKIEK